MSSPKVYLRCGCPKCGGPIEYPDYTVGGVMNCPKCGNQVRLPAAFAAPPIPQTPPSKPPSVPPPKVHATPPKRAARRSVAVVVGAGACCVALLAALAVAAGLAKHRKQSAPPELPGAEPPATHHSKSPDESAKPPAPAPKAKPPKAIADLRAGDSVSVEEPKGAKGSRLVYATGTVKNESDLLRYGVRVELDLLDAAGAKVGTATDYTASMEPRATWRFRALVVERRATSAKLAKITEDN